MTIRAILSARAEYSDLSNVTNRDFFTNILQQYSVINAEDEVTRLLDSQTSHTMIEIINQVLRYNIITCSDREQREQQCSDKADQVSGISEGVFCSNKYCSNYHYIPPQKEFSHKEESKVFDGELLKQKTNNENLQSELKKVKEECELKLRDMTIKVESSNLRAKVATEQLHLLQEDNFIKSKIINDYIDENKKEGVSTSGDNTNVKDVIERIFEELRLFRENTGKK